MALDRSVLGLCLSLAVAGGCTAAVEPSGSSGEAGSTSMNVQPSSGGESLTPSSSTVDSNSTVGSGSTVGSTSLIGSTEIGTSSGWGTSSTSGLTCWGDWPSGSCAFLETPGVEGTALTPAGPVSVSHAYFGAQSYCGGCVTEANIAVVYLLSDPLSADANEVDSAEMLELYLDGSDAFTGPTGTNIDGARLRVVRNGVVDETFDATFSIDMLPEPQSLAEPFVPERATTVTGRVQMMGDGWDVDLTFTAGYCPGGNVSYICE